MKNLNDPRPKYKKVEMPNWITNSLCQRQSLRPKMPHLKGETAVRNQFVEEHQLRRV